MRKFIAIAAGVAIFGASTLSPGVTRATIVTPYAMTGSQPVVTGVTHEWGSSQAEWYPDPENETDPPPPPELTTQQINILRVERDAPDFQFETSLPWDEVNNRQTTLGQALSESRPGHRVVAAINGDFWRYNNHGQRAPINFDIRNGELASAQTGERGAIGFLADGTPVIGRPTITMSATLPGATEVPLHGVNQILDSDEVILYTPTYDASTHTSSGGVEVVLSGVTLPLPVTGTLTGTVVRVGVDVMNTTIPAGSVVLSARGMYEGALAALAQNQTVTLNLAIDDPWQAVVNAVGGLRILVHEGIPATDFTTTAERVRNARTAAGMTADGGVILVTVDGSDDGTAGLTQADLAQLMASLGAVEAINLDGGGSTTMVVDPAADASLSVVNVPTEGHQRIVNTTLLLVSTIPEPDALMPTVTGPIVRFSSGTTAGKTDAAVDISWQAADADGVVLSTELEKLDAGVWLPVELPTPTTASINRRLKFNRDYQFRVRVTDDDGNQSDWSLGRIYRIGAVNERAAAIARTGKWPIVDRSSAIGGKIGRNSAKTKPGQSASLAYAAVQVAWIGPRTQLGGTAQVELDGLPTTTVALTRSKSLARAVLFVGPALDETSSTVPPSRTIKLTNMSTAARPYVDIDAFLLLTAR